jgi:hypothetical protein
MKNWLQIDLNEQFMTFCKDMGIKQATPLGKLDPLTNIVWNNGQLERNTGEGIITIQELIGGDDVSDYASFMLVEAGTIQIQTQGAIFQLLGNTGSAVIVDSSDAYESTLTATLQPGRYFLGYSSESSTPGFFTSQVTLL